MRQQANTNQKEKENQSMRDEPETTKMVIVDTQVTGVIGTVFKQLGTWPGLDGMRQVGAFKS